MVLKLQPMLIINNLELRWVNVNLYSDLRRGTEFRGFAFQIPWILPIQHLIFSLNVNSSLMAPNNSSPQSASWLTKISNDLSTTSTFFPIDAKNVP